VSNETTEYAIVPREPTDAMLATARDWSADAFGKPIGNDAARGCWGAMLSAAPSPQEAPVKPLVRPFGDTGTPEWQQIIALFNRYGAPPPGTRLRDELVVLLEWARYGETCSGPHQDARRAADSEQAITPVVVALRKLVDLFEHVLATPGYGSDECSRNEAADHLQKARLALSNVEGRS